MHQPEPVMRFSSHISINADMSFITVICHFPRRTMGGMGRGWEAEGFNCMEAYAWDR